MSDIFPQRSRLRILTWHVHGNYLYYLTQVPQDFYVVAKPGSPPGNAGLGGKLAWSDNVREIAYEDVADADFDCILYQSKAAYDARASLLSPAQLELPQLCIEHDPPWGHPTNTPHWFREPEGLLIHVTAFNALMWDSGDTPTRVVEHGVLIPDGVRYHGDKPRGIVVVNNLASRGRLLGSDIFERARKQVPLDLIGMDAVAMGGLGEVDNMAVPDFVSHYRFFFNPIRYTSFGLAVVEAMMAGTPVVGLATTEMATVFRSGENGFIDNRPGRLVEVMRELVADPELARRWGEAGRATAVQRFGIQRFIDDWLDVLASAAGHAPARLPNAMPECIS